ncbi:hypothetical protein [Rhodopirellula sp. MGV]|nr:hypothetical protein [Rhodopirellula sp. MGV]
MRPSAKAQWTDEEVAIRWLRVFPGKRLEEHLAEWEKVRGLDLVGFPVR